MTHRLWSRSIKKYLRREKARIRKSSKDPAEQARLFHALYDKFNLNSTIINKVKMVSDGGNRRSVASLKHENIKT